MFLLLCNILGPAVFTLKPRPNPISETIMATRRSARIPEDLARDMILNGWDEEPIGGIDSGSDISDVEDPEYCPSGHVWPSETQSAPAEQDQSDTEESSESSED
ncbi:hypothetical protein MHYP_G00022110 [Metynnis hypsauchen]